MTSTGRRAAPSRMPDRGDIANRLFFRLYQSSNLMHKVGTSAVVPFGITTQQWAVLGALSRPQAEGRGLSVKQLIEYLMVSRQSLTAILDRMEAAGLIERARTEGDGRLRHVRLTGQGIRTWADLQPSIRAFYESALADFSIEESHLLMCLLDRLSAGLAKI
jgi:MarR family transcriptional regulator, organic hydroperoxide resistance regulator